MEVTILLGYITLLKLLKRVSALHWIERMQSLSRQPVTVSFFLLTTQKRNLITQPKDLVLLQKSLEGIGLYTERITFCLLL